jgi:nucleotide-binding universal stress UspA family protein
MIAIQRVLCPVDESDFSARALAHAVALARWYSAELTVLHVYTAVPAPASIASAGATPVLAETDRQRVKEWVHRFAASRRLRAAAAGIHDREDHPQGALPGADGAARDRGRSTRAGRLQADRLCNRLLAVV